MRHTCHWPGCAIAVPPKLWGCKPHWFELPLHIRAEIGASYRRGQELDKLPSARYLAAVNAARAWIHEQGPSLPAI